MGGSALLAGVLPTPGIAFLTVDERATAGAVISASHNPFQDNGVKLFSAQCYKLTRSVAFVRALAHHGDTDNPVASAQGTFIIVED